MSTTWANVKDEFRDSFRDITQSYIDDNEAKRMLRRVLRDIGQEEAYTFQEQEYTLTLTGASQYDLDSLIAGWKKIKSITSPTSSGSPTIPIELTALDIKDFTVSVDRYAYAVFSNRYLRVYSPTNSPLTGTLKIIYYTQYLLSHSGTLVAEPTDDTTVFLIPDRYMNAVTEGMLFYGFRKDRSNRADYIDAKESYQNAIAALRDTHTVITETPLRTMMGAF